MRKLPKIFLLLQLLFFISNPLAGQNSSRSWLKNRNNVIEVSNIDSLENYIANLIWRYNDDTNSKKNLTSFDSLYLKVAPQFGLNNYDIAYRLGNLYATYSRVTHLSERGIYFLNIALQLSQQLKNDTLECNTLLSLSSLYTNAGNITESINALNQILNRPNPKHGTHKLGLIYYQLAVNYFDLNDHVKSYENFTLALQNDLPIETAVTSKIAIAQIYSILKDTTSFEIQLSEIKQTYKKELLYTIPSYLLTLINNYYSKGMYDTALVLSDTLCLIQVKDIDNRLLPAYQNHLELIKKVYSKDSAFKLLLNPGFIYNKYIGNPQLEMLKTTALLENIKDFTSPNYLSLSKKLDSLWSLGDSFNALKLSRISTGYLIFKAGYYKNIKQYDSSLLLYDTAIERYQNNQNYELAYSILDTTYKINLQLQRYDKLNIIHGKMLALKDSLKNKNDILTFQRVGIQEYKKKEENRILNEQKVNEYTLRIIIIISLIFTGLALFIIWNLKRKAIPEKYITWLSLIFTVLILEAIFLTIEFYWHHFVHGNVVYLYLAKILILSWLALKLHHHFNSLFKKLTIWVNNKSLLKSSIDLLKKIYRKIKPVQKKQKRKKLVSNKNELRKTK